MSTRTILIVDDERNIRLTVSQTLTAEDTKVETAINGEEALEKLRQQTFDLVLLDLRLPGMSGMEVLRRVREQHPEIAVLLLTAHGTVEDAVEAMRSGAVNVIQKPFAPRELREAVSRALKSKSSETSSARPDPATNDSTSPGAGTAQT